MKKRPNPSVAALPMNQSPSPEKSEALSPVPAAPKPVAAQKSNEVFLGGMIIMVVCLLLLLLAGTFGYFGYRLWQASQVTRSTPSIQELGEQVTEAQEKMEAPTEAPQPAPTAPETPAPAADTDKAQAEVRVLNGGGVRGGASALGEILKKAGFAKATFGNSVADYTGTTIYYAASSQKAAELIKEEVMKTYPKATLAPAQAGNKDMTAASVVVILGKE